MSIEDKIYSLLSQHNLTITTAESCTGGLICATLVNVAGMSSYLKEAHVTYCDEAKIKVLGVSPDTLQQYTAVSEQTAYEMAKGGAFAAGADICLSATGIAGPNSGGEGFPAGLVYLGCSIQNRITVEKYLFRGDRNTIRTQAVQKSLEHLYHRILTEFQ